jgi:hypothetical protein
MARFHFKIIQDGVVAAEEDGLEFDELETAELEAAIAMAETMAKNAAKIPSRSITVLISDDSRVLARVMVTMESERLS